MCYLLRKSESDYRLCYSEPKRPYVIDFTGSYCCANEYNEMCNKEREVTAWELMQEHNMPIDDWADVDQNDLGIPISKDVAEYLLQGKLLSKDEFIELTTVEIKGEQ